MRKRACDTASICIGEEKEYNKQRWDKSNMEPDFKEGEKVLVSTINFKNLKGPKKMRYSFVGSFNIVNLIGKMKKRSPTPPEIVEVEDTPGTVKKLIKARKIRLNGKDQRQYLVRFKNKTADKDKWLEEEALPDGNIRLRRFWASRRAEKSHQ
ncbi:hypothetical protein O181_031185 [Austropuccinia psidii MF-1]|uniref:Chromo domain-containing protein n=1 Tax=Austropuccinia psidii MF-1 TaxID=1389203 RepID=A0A9Q3H6Y3_9BASI|nr:hypothetical protein [Austropuccinia psidii MF-1]